MANQNGDSRNGDSQNGDSRIVFNQEPYVFVKQKASNTNSI